MTHVDLGLGWILQNLCVVNICLLYQYLTDQDLNPLIAKEVLQQLFFVLGFELIYRYLVQVLYFNLIRPDPGAFDVL